MQLLTAEWNIVLELKKLLSNNNFNQVECVVLNVITNQWHINSDLDPDCSFTISFNKDNSKFNSWYPKQRYQWDTPVVSHFTEEQNDFFVLYIVPVLQTFQARANNEMLITAHITQTIDGKIALNNGISQWIGNEADRIHTHRMRALCDGVMIGNKTADIDQPGLNVRHVAGDHPIKIVVGNSRTNIQSLKKEGKLLVISNSLLYPDEPNIKNIVINKPGRFAATDIASVLLENNIYHLFVEGGANLISGLLKDEAIDVLQIHIAPVIFGSGKDAIALPEIDNLNNAISSKHIQFFKLDDQYLMQLNYQTK